MSEIDQKNRAEASFGVPSPDNSEKAKNLQETRSSLEKILNQTSDPKAAEAIRQSIEALDISRADSKKSSVVTPSEIESPASESQADAKQLLEALQGASLINEKKDSADAHDLTNLIR